MNATATHSMRQTIVTKYHGPGNVRGSRVSATCQAGKVIIEWDNALNSDQNHAAACVALCKKINRDAQYVGGSIGPDTQAWVELP